MGCDLPESTAGLELTQNDDGTYTVTGIGSCTQTDIVISFYNGKDVTTIAERAFASCYYFTSVTIGNGVTSIGDYAFYYCDSLMNVYYKGTASDWKKISIESYNGYLTGATCYYYSETQPTDSDNYWHYDTDGKFPVAWKKEN